MDLDEKLKKAQRLEKKSYYISEYLFRVLIIQKFILLPLAKTPITPNFITILSAIFAVLSFYFIYLGHFICAGLLFLVYSLLDHIDGMLARYKNLSSKIGKLLDASVDNLTFNGIFIFLFFCDLISLQACIFALVSMNIYNCITTFYILNQLRKLKSIKRFGLKKWFLDRGFLLGIDASLLAILISAGIMLGAFELMCYVVGGIFLFDLCYRLIELYANIKERKNDDKHYWAKFYQNNQSPFLPSLFAKFILKYAPKNAQLLELGCGNGRDSVFFYEKGMRVKAIDACKSEIEYLKANYAKNNLEFENADFCALNEISNAYDVIYSRFTLHSITKSEQESLLPFVYKALKAQGIFCVEARGLKNSLYNQGLASGDNAFIYDEHYRRFLDFEILCDELKILGFNLLFAKEDKGFAPFKNEDDIFIRIIAQK